MPNYVTAEEVKSFAKLTYEDLGYADEEQYDAFLNDLITASESLVEQYCNVPSGYFQAGGVSFQNQLYDYRYPIFLRYTPVISVQSVEINTASYGQSPNWVTLETTEYVVNAEAGCIYLVKRIPAVTLQSVRVSYTAGYSSTPEVVRHVVKALCSNMLHEILQRKISPLIRVEDWTIRLVVPESFTNELKTMLTPYVRRTIGAG